MQDVLAALRRKGLAFQGWFDPTRPAVLAPETCARVNYETFLFAEPAGRERFLADPARYCGTLTDPVSKRRFRPAADAPRAEHGGVLWLFPSAASRARFLADPERFELPRTTM